MRFKDSRPFHTLFIRLIYLESIRYLGPNILKLIPDEVIELKSVEHFKEKVKSFNSEKSSCKIYKCHICISAITTLAK